MENILVAKSYQDLPKVGEVFTSSGRQYINVQLKSGKLKTVRAYSEAEFAKLYPEMKPMVQVQNAFYKPQKEVLGFTKGYITIFKGDTYAHIDWFRESIARYARWWGWYIISTEKIPDDLPDDIEPIQLPWEVVGNDDGKLKPESIVEKAVEELLYDAGTSEFVGEIGERIELTLTVISAIKIENNYGHSTMHIMEDDCGNVYVWTTAAKSWSEGSVKTIRGTIKNHRTYKNTKQTVLTRCMEVK